MKRKKAPEIEVRIATLIDGRQEFDEVVASNASVHLEKMTDQEFCLIVETAHEVACFRIFSKNYRAHVDADEFWRDAK